MLHINSFSDPFTNHSSFLGADCVCLQSGLAKGFFVHFDLSSSTTKTWSAIFGYNALKTANISRISLLTLCSIAGLCDPFLRWSAEGASFHIPCPRGTKVAENTNMNPSRESSFFSVEEKFFSPYGNSFARAHQHHLIAPWTLSSPFATPLNLDLFFIDLSTNPSPCLLVTTPKKRPRKK